MSQGGNAIIAVRCDVVGIRASLQIYAYGTVCLWKVLDMEDVN